MKLQCSTFIMPHIGDKYSQCADRFAISEDGHHFAIADGVGASFFPAIWAEIVSNDFVQHSESFIDKNVLVNEARLIGEWNDKVKVATANLSDKENFLIEMAKDKCDFAACTFVGLTIDKDKWHCQALGDSYLFILNDEYEIIESVASQQGQDFDNFPEYFASYHGKNNGSVLVKSGNISNIAYFVLLTDAISDWFIKADSNKRKALVELQNLQDFRSFIDVERANNAMKDDDTTAVVIKVIADGEETISVEQLWFTDIANCIESERNESAKNTIIPTGNKTINNVDSYEQEKNSITEDEVEKGNSKTNAVEESCTKEKSNSDKEIVSSTEVENTDTSEISPMQSLIQSIKEDLRNLRAIACNRGIESKGLKLLDDCAKLLRKFESAIKTKNKKKYGTTNKNTNKRRRRK